MKRISIDRLDLDLRGVSRDTADNATRLLGPALARALAARRLSATGAERIDGGHVAGSADAGTIATGIAQRIAAKTSRSRS
jgi:hypothetical protein